MDEWEKKVRQDLSERGKGLKLHDLEVVKVSAPNARTGFEISKEGHVLVLTPGGRSPSISLKVKPGIEKLTGLRIVFYPNEKLPDGGLGHGSKASFPGSFMLTSFAASGTTVPSDQVDLYAMFNVAKITASVAHPDYPPEDCLDHVIILGGLLL